LEKRLAQYQRGHNCTTRRLGEKLEVVASNQVETPAAARHMERILKAKKNPKLAIHYLRE
jgi:hypothetical protein